MSAEPIIADEILSVLEAVGGTVWSRNLLTDEIAVTPGLWLALGYPEATLPRSLPEALEVFDPDDARQMLEELERYLSGERPTYRFSAQVKAANGELRWLSLTAAVLSRDATGKAVTVGGLISDVTEQIEQERQQASAETQLQQLSQREKEVMFGIVGGRTSKEIALDLDLSPRTVDFYRARLMDKLGLKNVPELALLCSRAGLCARLPH